jgi:pilus assembly protein Flp/PilA
MFALRILTFFQPLEAQIPVSLRGDRVAQGCVNCVVTEPRGSTEMIKFVKLLKNQKGATAIEYGLIAALIAVAAIGAMQGIGSKLNTTFNNVSNSLI